MGDKQDKMGYDQFGRRKKGILGWNIQRPAQSAASSGSSDQQVDPARLKMIENQLLENQNFSLGMLAGLIAATGGAILWALLSYATNYQIGFMAIGVGFVVGLAIRRFGAGYGAKYGIGGAIFSLYGVVFGNLILICLFIAKEYNVAFFDVFSKLNFKLCWTLLKAGFDGMDVLFYGIALYFGYKYSMKDLTKDQMEKLAMQSGLGGPSL